jgi:hypothetical protein
MGAGKNIDMGVADTLGERLKQVEALRAKRAQTAEERALEQQQFEGANLGTLTSNIAAFKDRPEVVAALENLRPAAKYMKQNDFLKAVYQAVMNPPTLAGKEAGIEKTEAGTTRLEGQAATEEATRGPKVDLLKARAGLTQAQTDKLRKQAISVKQVADTKVANEVRAAGKDAAAAEKAITRAMETAESDKLGIAGNIRDFQGLEAVAPGFTQGKVPSWLGQGSIAAARKVPALSKQAAELSSALETFIANIRKSLFGASLTGNEKASFDAIVGSGLLMPPATLAANINRLRQGAARFAQNHFTVAATLHPDVTGRVLGNSALFSPALREGGIYSDVWKLPAAPAAGGGAGSTSGMTRMIAPDGSGKYDIPNDKVAAAKAKGWKEQ